MNRVKTDYIRKKIFAGVLILILAPFGFGQKVLPTSAQQQILDADFAQPADQAAVKIDSALVLKDGQPNPNFGNPQERFLSKHNTFLSQRDLPIELLFIGDSITEAWQTTGADIWKASFTDRYSVANFGISGDRIQHVLWRIENGELDGVKPKTVVLLIGTNNTAHNTPEEIAAGVTRIVERIQEKIPSAKILLLNLLPRSPKPGDSRRMIVMKTNEILAAAADGDRLLFIRIWDEFLNDDGTLKTDLMPDALHPNKAGYEVMAGIIGKALAEQKP